jgi:hypothetical protein
MQAQYLYQTSITNLNETQNQLNKLRILCSVKDRKASQLQNLCEEFREKYQSDTRTLQHQLELSERKKYDVLFCLTQTCFVVVKDQNMIGNKDIN